jgi:hypothetical protein
MKFYLSAPPVEWLPEGPLTVKVNNVSRRKEQRKGENRLLKTQDEGYIDELNDLASKPPFCFIYRVKKYDTL